MISLGRMPTSSDELQPEAMQAFREVVFRAREVVDAELLGLIEHRISSTLGHSMADLDVSNPPLTPRDIDCLALVDQMLIDVSAMTDETVFAAARHFEPGGLSDLITAAYLTEARIRLEICAGLLLGTRT